MNDVAVKMSTYSVLPWQESNGLLHCLYFDENMQLVASDELDCHAQHGNVDFLRLRPFTDTVPQSIRADYDLVEHATLFAAVVKTVTESTGLTNTYMADSSWGLVLPVMPRTHRSTILIFKLPDTTAGAGACRLIATSDPEIKNSADGARQGG